MSSCARMTGKRSRPCLQLVLGPPETGVLRRCMSYDCAMVSRGERERKKGSGCALRCGAAN